MTVAEVVMSATRTDLHALRLWAMRHEWARGLWNNFPDSLLPYQRYLTLDDVTDAVAFTHE